MGPETQRLIEVLRELSELLVALDHPHWAAWMRESERRLSNGDGSGILHLLGAFGGMGSFNDLRLGGDHGRRVEQLRSEAWQLAEDIRKEAGPGR